MDQKQNTTLFNKILEYKSNQISYISRTEQLEEQVKRLRRDLDNLMKCNQNQFLPPIQEIPEVMQFDDQKSARPQTAPPQKIVVLDDELVEKVQPLVPPIQIYAEKKKKYVLNWS